MDESKKPEPKINLVFVMLGFVGFAVFDALSLIPGVADFLEVPDAIVLIIGGITGLGPAFIIAEIFADLIKLFPVSQALPVWTIAWIITVIIDRHPSKATAIIEKTAELASAAEGNAGAAEGAAENEALNEAAREAEATAEQGAAAGSVSGEAGGAAKGRPSEAPQEGGGEAAEPGANGGEHGESDDKIGGEAFGERPEDMEALKENLLGPNVEGRDQNDGQDQDEEEAGATPQGPQLVPETDLQRERREAKEKEEAVRRNLKKINPPQQNAA